MFHQIAGRAKVIAGRVIGSPGLEAEGNVEMGAGKIQEKTGKAKKAVKKHVVKSRRSTTRTKAKTKTT